MKPIETLAEYLTGPLVHYQSIGLAMADPAVHQRAEAYFKLREEFGVRGYVSKEEAAQAIRQTMLTHALAEL